MSRSADVVEQALAHGVRAAVPFMVTPGSEQVRATIERDGQMTTLEAIGATVLANACGPCIGQWRRSQEMVGVPNTILTSYNRNFPMRNDGQASTMNFIGSPEIVTALALAGRLSFNPLTDSLTGADGQPFRLRPPEPAPEVPADDFERGHSSYVAPPEDESRIELKVDPNSERLQMRETTKKHLRRRGSDSPPINLPIPKSTTVVRPSKSRKRQSQNPSRLAL